MNKTLTLLLTGALCTMAAAETPAQLAEAKYRQGLAAEKKGNPDAARHAFTEALRANPRHAEARYRLGQLKVTGPAIAAKGREAKFGAVVIPVIKLEDATLQEAIEAFGQMVEKESEGEVTPNFVIQDPKGKLADTRISIQLKAVPAKGVLEYILTQAGGKARFDEHAVVIMPR